MTTVMLRILVEVRGLLVEGSPSASSSDAFALCRFIHRLDDVHTARVPRDIRQEIESCDAALRDARKELAALKERHAGASQVRELKLTALRAQALAIDTALTELESKTTALEAERRSFRGEINDGRGELSARQPLFTPGQPEPIIKTSITEVIRPTGWRKGQPWYTRLLYWIIQPPEWK